MKVVDVDEVPTTMPRQRAGKYKQVIDEFVESGKPWVEIVLEEGDAKPQHVYSALRTAIKKAGNIGVRVVKRGERIFLIKWSRDLVRE